MSLRERAMVVSLSISAWRGQRIDRQTTNEVVAQKNTSKDAFRVEKYLVPPKTLEPIKKAETAARAAFRRLSLPWGRNGDGIISAEAFFDFSREMDEHRLEFQRVTRDLVTHFPQIQAEQPLRLNGAYEASDYPSQAELETKFGFHLSIMPIPDKTDFRVSLGEEAEAEIRKNIEDTVNARTQEAQRELWDRLLTTLKHFVSTMSEEDKIFRNTTVTNLAEIAKLAPKLTLAPDPQLEAVCADILRIANSVDPDVLRQDPKVRAATATKAARTLEQVEEAMAGVFA